MPAGLLEVGGEGLMLLLGGGKDGAGGAIPQVLVAEYGHTDTLIQRFGILEGAEHDVLVASPLVLAGGACVVVHAGHGLTEADADDEADVVGFDDILPDQTGLVEGPGGMLKAEVDLGADVIDVAGLPHHLSTSA